MLRFFLTLSIILCFLTQIRSQNFEKWKTDRRSELLAEDGWINLIDLIWIDEEKSFLNQISQDSISISSNPTKKNIGTFQFINDSIWFFFNPKISKKIKSQSPAKILQYPTANYSKGGVYYGRWKWTVIKRGEQVGMRLRDLEHPGIASFSPIPYFEYDSTFAIEAFFLPKFNETMDIPNVLGQIIEWKVLGVLKFELKGKEYELTALDEAGKFFVIFSDLTNETETYPIGRYLYVNFPDKNGTTKVDFNFSYNPPCAFTAFATCPIPPKENRLNLDIRAGEKIPKEK